MPVIPRQTKNDLNSLIPHSKENHLLIHLGTEAYSSPSNSNTKHLSKDFPLILMRPISFFMWEVPLGIKIERQFSVPLSMLTQQTKLEFKTVLVGPEPSKRGNG